MCTSESLSNLFNSLWQVPPQLVSQLIPHNTAHLKNRHNTNSQKNKRHVKSSAFPHTLRLIAQFNTSPINRSFRKTVFIQYTVPLQLLFAENVCKIASRVVGGAELPQLRFNGFQCRISFTGQVGLSSSSGSPTNWLYRSVCT